MAGLYFDQFVKDQTIKHKKTVHITRFGNFLFNLITANPQAHHKGKNPIINGLYVLAGVVGATVPDLTQDTLLVVGEYENIRHHAIVRVGDILTVETTVTKTEASTDLDKGKVWLRYEARNQNGELVLSLTRFNLIKRS